LKPETNDTKPETQQTASARTGWRRFVLNQQWIVRNIPFFLFLCLLAVIYIYNGHYAEKTIKDINKNAHELKELQYEYKTVKSELMFTTKQSEVAKAVAPLGLHELSHPPYRLADSLALK
jgi:cell division protein FtsL